MILNRESVLKTLFVFLLATLFANSLYAQEALEANTDNSNSQPIIISCETLKKYDPNIDCSKYSSDKTDRMSSETEVIIIEPQVEVVESPAGSEPEWPPKATFDYTKESDVLNRLRKVARNNNCLPVWDLSGIDLNFFGPWHVDISELTGNQGDYIFICRSNSDKFKFNVILLAQNDREIWKGCPTKAYAGTSIPYPLGLAVYAQDSTFHFRDLANWLSQDGKSGPAGVSPSDPVIDTAKHDSGVVLTCHKKIWYGFLYH